MKPIEWCDCGADDCIAQKGKCKSGKELPPINFPQEKDLDRIDARIGGSWTWKKPKIQLGIAANEATTVSGVATTDTRFYGATWEGNFFLQKPAIGAWENESKFWDNPSILGYGYTYYKVKDGAIGGLGSTTISVIGTKADLDDAQTPNDSYNDQIKKLAKAHNID